MKNSKNDEHAILMTIIRQLSDLNERLSGPETAAVMDKPVKQKLPNSFLFGFELNGAASGEDYRKYFTFLDTITPVLNEFGIHMGNNGYAYILDSVKIILDRESYDLRLKSDIYPLIAARYRLKNYSAVEHSIRNAINSAFNDYQRNPAANKMGVFGRRPTNKQFLIYIADTVTKSMCESMMRAS